MKTQLRKKKNPSARKKHAKPGTPRPSAVDLAPLHDALQECFPALRHGLSASVMDAEGRVAHLTDNAEDFKFWYLESQVLKRFTGTSNVSAATREGAAIQKLLDSEVACRESNSRLYGALSNSSTIDPGVKKVLKRARMILSEMLGPFNINDLPRACGFGPGASLELTRARSSLQHKWALATHITAKALPYHHAFVRWAGLDGVTSSVTIISHNKVFTVTKNFEVDRAACKEAGLLSFYQKGMGTLTRRAMRRSRGLLLPDAQEYHQVLAKIGSATGALSTLDLVGASNHLCCALVAELVREDWARHYFALRSPQGVLPDGTEVTWEKISTMGNGYTFELETAIFYAITSAVCGKDALVSVYGDDIICPTKYAARVTEILNFCGFELNLDKSFSDGPFRESCGGHYWKGIDVKPFYLRQLPRQLDEIINLHNSIVTWVGEGVTPLRFAKVKRLCRKLVPRSYWGPHGLSGVLWAEWDECRPVYKPKHQAWVVKSVSRVMKLHKDSDCYMGGYLAQLWVVPNDDEAFEFSNHSYQGDGLKTTARHVCRTQWNSHRLNLLCSRRQLAL